MSQIEITDIEQAKLIISMKNDEIKNINNKMKMIEKKSNIKIAESNYQIQQQKNKYADLEKKIEKLKENQEQELKKFEESEEKLKAEISKLKQNINEVLKNERQTERSHKAQIYEQELKLNEEREKRQSLKKQLELILKIFNPKQIIQTLNLQYIQQLVPYIKLIEKLKQQQQQITYLKRQMEQYKSESLKAIEETFSKLNSYEEVMGALREKNMELEQIMIEKEKNLQEKHIELEEKSLMLKEVEALTKQKYYEMNEEIESLRRSVSNYERQSLNYKQSKQQHEKNLKFLFQLSNQFSRKQQDYLNKITELQNAFQNIENQKQEVEREFKQHLANYKDEVYQYQCAVERAEKNVKDKQEIIVMLRNGLKELEMQMEFKKQQLDKSKLEISELLRRKYKLQEELREAKQFYESKEQSLLEEIQLLKNYRGSGDYRVEEGREEANGAPTSLEDQLEPEPNWFEMYQNCLQRHNKFIKQIHYLLRKQERKQSLTADEDLKKSLVA